MPQIAYGWIIALTCIVGVGPARSDMISAPVLQADVAVLEHAYRELHPGLRRYLSDAQLDAAFAALRQEFTQDRTPAQAYVSLARFAAKIRCGHTYPNFFNQSKSIQQQVLEQSARLPFYFQWIDRVAVVTRDFTAKGSLPRGTKILAIGGHSTATILARLMALARADGANDAKRVDQLGVTGDSLYESFDVYFPLLFRLPHGLVELQVQVPGALRSRQVIVPTLTYTERVAPIAIREAARRGGSEVLFEWRDLDNGAAYLRMSNWALYNSHWDWRSWLNQRLDTLAARKAPALIIDLRGNEGGEDVGEAILARVIATDLPLDSMQRLTRYRTVPADLAPLLDTWDPSFKDWGAAATELASPWPAAPPVHYFALNRDDDPRQASAVIAPVTPRFSGRLFVIVDASNSSATFQFADLVQSRGLGTLVGQPTGGNRRGINGGAFFFLRLPGSGIEMDLPLIGTFPAGLQPDRGLIPDILIRPTAANIASNTDAELSAIERLLVTAMNRPTKNTADR